MRHLKLWLAFLYAAAPAHALDLSFSATTFTVESKATKLAASADLGWLVGVGSRKYFPMSPVSLGVCGFFGSPTGKAIAQDNFAYLGFPLHLDGKLSRWVVYDVGVLAGYSQGNIDAKLKSTGWVFEPSVALGLALGSGWQLTLSGSYIHHFVDDTFTGITFGIRIERNSFNVRASL